MDSPSKPASLGPQAGKSFGVSTGAIVAIVATVMLSGICCAGFIVAGTFVAAAAERERARREAIEADRAVAASFQEASAAIRDSNAVLSKAPAELEAAMMQTMESVEQFESRFGAGADENAVSVGNAADPRTWTRGDFTLKASFVRLDGANVILRKEDGTEISVPLDELSAGDQCVATMSAPQAGESGQAP
jgi:hypothetical protein